MATIGSYYVEKAAFAARNKGIDVDALIKIAGAEAGNIFKPNQRVSDNAMTLYLNLLANATNDAFLGFANKPVPLVFFKVFIQNLYYCHDLREAIGAMQSTLQLADCHLSYQETEKNVTLSLQLYHNDPHHFVLEYLLVLVHRLFSWLSGQQVNAQRGSISYTPKAYRQEFSLLFRCPMAFESTQNSLTFDRSVLNLSIIRQKEEFQKLIKQFPLIVMRYPGEEKLFDRHVHQLLLEHFNQHSQLPSAHAIAKQLEMSNATLRRKLAFLLTSFAQIKLELRKALSTRLLSQSNISIEEIAYQLSYSDTRSFSRAFKQWTDMTPSAYRRQTSGNDNF